ncbi:hypothetical protein ACM66B_000836 [Microbotryomycetes sp. NB124-2]
MSTIKLVPFDPEDAMQLDELHRQRVLCGWNVDAIGKWQKFVRQGLKALFWVFPADNEESRKTWLHDMPEQDVCNLCPEIGPPPNPSFRPLGHCSLDWYDDLGDEQLACRDKSPRRIQLSTLYTLKHLAGRGLGNLLLQELERIAAQPPFEADYVTLNTMDRSRATDEAYAKTFGWHFNKDVRVNQDWYERKGYTVFRRMVPRYEDRRIDGQIVKIEAAYLEKKLKR